MHLANCKVPSTDNYEKYLIFGKMAFKSKTGRNYRNLAGTL